MNRRSTQTEVSTVGGTEHRGEPLRQPNDRDESSSDARHFDELASVQRAQMERARRDVEGPTRDTECRSLPQPGDDCAQPQDPSLLDDVLRPGDPQARNAENRRGAKHDPGAPAPRPDGSSER